MGIGSGDRAEPPSRASEVERRPVRVDLHCHSNASAVSRLGVQRAVGLPECATPPEEVYELAKRRGMDFVTITDHDTIDGALQIAAQPDAFVSEELTAHFRGEPQAVHVLCYGITPDDHEWLQAHRGDVEECAEYLAGKKVACALAHPYYAVSAPLSARHRRRLAELFAVWEIRNGSRAPELNMPAATYIATRDGAGIGGSDDHAGLDIGRTWTALPPADDPQQLLEHIRRGRVSAGGAHGGVAKWTHTAIALASRSIGCEQPGAAAEPPHPLTVMRMVRRVLAEGEMREGHPGGDLGPADARRLLRAWLDAVGLQDLDGRGLVALMQQDDFSHAALHRRACRAHERKLRAAAQNAVIAASDSQAIEVAAVGLFEACIAAIPYAPAAAFLARERAKLDAGRRDGEPPRIAILADGIGSTHGVTRTLQEIRERGVPGFEIEVIGTDPDVDRRLPAVAEVEVPFYPGMQIGVPSLPSAVQALTEGCFDAIHVCSPGPAGVAGALLARAMGLPLLGSYHTELTAYAQLRSGRRQIAEAMQTAVGALYRACEVVLSPSRPADRALAGIGVPPERILRFDRGVDMQRFSPALRGCRAVRAQPEAPERSGGPDAGAHFRRPIDRVNVLYAGRITHEKGSELLADAFLTAARTDPRLHLQLAGGGPEQQILSERVGERASLLGWLAGERLAAAYANADIFVFPSATDTFGQVILEAQASGLPVVAVARGGPIALLEHRVSGLLCEPEPSEMARAILELAGSASLRQSLARAGLAAARRRTWERALQQLAAGYREALGGQRSSALSAPRAA